MEKIYKGEILRLFPIFEAIKEGKTIQWLDMGLWRDIDGDDEGFFLDTLVGKTDGYRIKTEPKYRPFANAEECWNEMLKHQPFGVVKDKYYAKFQVYRSFTTLLVNGCNFRGYEDSNFLNNFNNLLFADGTPFGVKAE